MDLLGPLYEVPVNRGSAVGQRICCAFTLCLFGMFFGAGVSAEEAAEKKASPALKSIGSYLAPLRSSSVAARATGSESS